MRFPLKILLWLSFLLIINLLIAVGIVNGMLGCVVFTALFAAAWALDKAVAVHYDNQTIPEQPKEEQQGMQTYLMEARNGLLVDVPEDKLEAWLKAQEEEPRPLTEQEKKLSEAIVRMLYGDTNRRG